MKTDQLLDLVKTEDDRKNILDLLTAVNQTLYKVGKSRTKEIELNTKFGPALLTCLSADFEKLEPVVAQKEIEKIVSKIKSIPVIDIIVATEPTPTSLEALEGFAKSKIKKNFILSIKIKPAILGGAIFLIEGKYIDLSVANKLSSAFNENTIQDFLKNQEA